MENELSEKSKVPAFTAISLLMAVVFLVTRGPVIGLIKALVGLAAFLVRPVLLVIGVLKAVSFVGQAITKKAESHESPVPLKTAAV